MCIWDSIARYRNPGYQMKNTIRVQRAIRNMTQEDLALALGVTRQTIIAIESGKYDPSMKLAFKMAKFFEKPIEELFFDD